MITITIMGMAISVIKLLPLLLLCACAKQDHWALDTVRAGGEAFNSSKLCYRADDRINGIDLELLSTSEKLSIFLNVHSQAAPIYPNDPKKTLVKISSPQKKLLILAHRREGGQRLLLPESTYSFILSTLQSGEPLTLQIPGYITTIEPERFSKHFEKFQHPFPFDLIIDLPYH